MKISENRSYPTKKFKRNKKKKASVINHDRPLMTFHESGRISIYTPLGLDFGMTTLTLTAPPARPAFTKTKQSFPMASVESKDHLLQGTT